MKHEHRDENASRKVRHPRWDRRVTTSLGDEEHGYPN